MSTPENISIQFIFGHRSIACADLSVISDLYGDLYYFNRLKVEAPHKGKGLGSELLQMVQIEAAKHRKGIWCDPSPYDGHEFLRALIRFYKRHGFVEVADTQSTDYWETGKRYHLEWKP
jgi:GNAT superfamily N-acetyltransferase